MSQINETPLEHAELGDAPLLVTASDALAVTVTESALGWPRVLIVDLVAADVVILK